MGDELFEMSRVTVVRYIDEDGDDSICVSSAGPGDTRLDHVEACGLLELAKLRLVVPSIVVKTVGE